MNSAVNKHLDNISLELSFMLLVLRDYNHLDQEKLLQYITKLDWDLFMKLVMHHRVYPLIYMKLKEFTFMGIPIEIMKKLQSHYNLNVLKMMRLSREMSVICKSFEENEIRAIQLKGPILAIQLYGDLSLRTSKDLDILVSIDDVEKSIDVLKKLGYIPEQKNLLSNWKKKSHHISLYHSTHSVQVEIHWRLNPYQEEFLPFNNLWDRKNEMKILHQSFYFLGDEDLFCYLVDHGARHGWFRLRWLVDIDRIIKSEKKVLNIENGLNKEGQIYLEQALMLASQLLSSSEEHNNKEIFSFSARKRKLYNLSYNCIVKAHESEKSTLKKYNRYTRSLMTGKQKIHYIISLLLPSPRDVDIFPLPNNLHFLYFPLRPFLLVWRYVNHIRNRT